MNPYRCTTWRDALGAIAFTALLILASGIVEAI